MSVHDFRWMNTERTSEEAASANMERAAVVSFLRKQVTRTGWELALAIEAIERGEHYEHPIVQALCEPHEEG